MIIDCISDLHGYYPDLEGGDLLIIAGDLTARDQEREYWQFNNWLECQEYKKKIIVAGNHDHYLYEGINIGDNPFKDAGGEYLFDAGTEFEGLKIWGSPWTTTFQGMNPRGRAFTVHTDEQLADKFEKIQHDIDILVTHSPPFGILDLVPYRDFIKGAEHVGSRYLYAWFKYVGRPKLHVFGHIHECYGMEERFAGYNDTMVKSVNASYVNEFYQPVNPPIRIIL
jgi:Icc-related predicted phosphoesterase